MKCLTIGPGRGCNPSPLEYLWEALTLVSVRIIDNSTGCINVRSVEQRTDTVFIVKTNRLVLCVEIIAYMKQKMWISCVNERNMSSYQWAKLLIGCIYRRLYCYTDWHKVTWPSRFKNREVVGTITGSLARQKVPGRLVQFVSVEGRRWISHIVSKCTCCVSTFQLTCCLCQGT